MKRFFLPLIATLSNMRSAPLRTFLTILGMVIGIASVTIVMSTGQSAQNLILDQIRGAGSNIIAVLPGASDENGPPAQMLGIVATSVTNDDLVALRQVRHVPHATAVSGYVTGSAMTQFREHSTVVTFQGVSPDVINVENITVKQGRFFTKSENNQHARVAVIGSSRAEDFFGNDNPVGEKISIDNMSFLVIGVLQPRGALGFFNPDETIYLPLLTAQKQILGIDYLNFIRLKTSSEEQLAQTKNDVQALLRARHDIRTGDEDDFSVRDLASALSIITSVTNIIKLFLVIVAAISLIVGGIGVMNVMFIALSQRLREIGLRKALGATRYDIALQFLIEAIMVAVIGGIVGIIIGIAVTVAIAFGAEHFDYNWQLVITWNAIGVSIGISLMIGIIFGMYPAIKASRVSPIEALRYE